MSDDHEHGWQRSVMASGEVWVMCRWCGRSIEQVKAEQATTEQGETEQARLGL